MSYRGADAAVIYKVESPNEISLSGMPPEKPPAEKVFPCYTILLLHQDQKVPRQ